MDDLISRQAAIDAIKEFKHGAAEWRDEQEEHSDIWHRADSAIASALEIGLRVKKIPSAQQWIPCSERLPDQNWKYLVVGRQKAINILKFDGGRWYGKWGVVAWMPLPEPYREETES